MTTRATYTCLASPIAQIQAVEDFLGQMESTVGDGWRESEDPKDNAKAESAEAEDFLEMLNEGEFVIPVLEALKEQGVRFENDGEEDAEGRFLHNPTGNVVDFVLRRLVAGFSDHVIKFAPEGWERGETEQCLGWENLVLVPDHEGAVAQALRLLESQSEAPVETAKSERS